MVNMVKIKLRPLNVSMLAFRSKHRWALNSASELLVLDSPPLLLHFALWAAEKVQQTKSAFRSLFECHLDYKALRRGIRQEFVLYFLLFFSHFTQVPHLTFCHYRCCCCFLEIMIFCAGRTCGFKIQGAACWYYGFKRLWCRNEKPVQQRITTTKAGVMGNFAVFTRI